MGVAQQVVYEQLIEDCSMSNWFYGCTNQKTVASSTYRM